MACGGFEALSWPAQLNQATERKPYWQAFIRHKLDALLCAAFILWFILT